MEFVKIAVEAKAKQLRSPQEWQAIVKLYKSSGLNITAFCKKNNIGRSSLYYWLNLDTATEAKVTKSNKESDLIDFAKIIVTKPYNLKESDNKIIISLANGINIQLPNDYESNLLLTLIKGLQ